MKATIYFTDKERGWAGIPCDKIFTDDVGCGQMLFVYLGDELRGIYRLDAIDSVHMTVSAK